MCTLSAGEDLEELLASSLDGDDMTAILDDAEKFIEEAQDTLDDLFGNTAEEGDTMFNYHSEKSDASTTSGGHSGWARTTTSGNCLRAFSISSTVNFS